MGQMREIEGTRNGLMRTCYRCKGLYNVNKFRRPNIRGIMETFKLCNPCAKELHQENLQRRGWEKRDGEMGRVCPQCGEFKVSGSYRRGHTYKICADCRNPQSDVVLENGRKLAKSDTIPAKIKNYAWGKLHFDGANPYDPQVLGCDAGWALAEGL